MNKKEFCFKRGTILNSFIKENNNKIRVLIVEEDEDICSLLAATCGLQGFETIKTDSSDACLNAIKNSEEKLDVVIMSGKIAEDKGAQLILKIKEIDPIIKIITLIDNESNKTRILEYGADDFIVKPVSAETVLDKVTLILAKER